MAPAVAGSTGLVTGAAVLGAFDSSLAPPPHAAPIAAVHSAAQASRRTTECMNDSRIFNFTTRPGGHDFAQHAILHPLRAPPVHRRHLLTADEHREVEMIAAGQPGHAAAAELVSLLDH